MAVTVEWLQEPEDLRADREAEVLRLAGRLADLGAHRVILFGSRARGDSTRDSDIDIIAVMPCDPSWSFARRLAEVGASIDPRYATDLLVYTPEEFERLSRENRFIRQAVEGGRLLYERESDRPRGKQ
jgi:predicted nucleotidyltransferase